MSPLDVLIIAAVGLASGVVNTLAGAGTLVTLPALMFLGLPAPMANATGRVGVVLQSAAATAAYHKNERLDLPVALKSLGPACLGALAGAQVSAVLDPRLFERIVAVAMLLVLAALLVPWPARLRPTPRPALRVPLFLVLGFYGGFLQAGVGLFLLAALRLTDGLDLVSGNAVKALLVLGFTVVALTVFGLHGLVDLPVALALTGGSALGGWIGGHLALRGGTRLIKAALTLTVLASSTRLLGLW